MAIRQQATEEEIVGALAAFEVALRAQLKSRPGFYVSEHEGMGHITEELHELVAAVSDKVGGDLIQLQALDVAVAAVWTSASVHKAK